MRNIKLLFFWVDMTGKILIVLAVLVVLGAVTETSAHPLAIMDLGRLEPLL